VVDSYLTSLQGEAAAAAGSDGHRHGSGELRVNSVELLDASGKPVGAVRTGDEVTFRYHYEAQRPIERPIFGIGIYTRDGILATGPNLKDVDQVPDMIEGTGIVDLHVPRLLLLPGTYEVASGVTDEAILHVHDWWRKALKFDVLPGRPRESAGGFFSMDGTWILRPS
jgi:ABC-2 type transport system ATP-binding protein